MIYWDAAILGSDKLEGFKKKHPAARKALAKWESVVSAAAWNNFAELKASFHSADYVEGYTVFDIGGNKYRLIAIVSYRSQRVAIERVLTHEEYGREGWKA